MKNMLVLGSVGLGALVAVSSCGGGGGTCGVAAPCGGDIVGMWNITSSCVSVRVMNVVPECPAATGESVDVKITGSIAFGADMTYSSQSTTTGKVRVTLPAECLMGATCAELQAALDDPAMPTTCTGSGGCVCIVTQPPETSTETGTYSTTTAGALTQTAAGGTADTSNYCVKGTTLTMSSQETMMGQQVSGTITLSKQ